MQGVFIIPFMNVNLILVRKLLIHPIAPYPTSAASHDGSALKVYHLYGILNTVISENIAHL